MATLLPERRFVRSRFSEKYETPAGAIPSGASLDDVFQEDLDAAKLVADYLENGESYVTRLTRLRRWFFPNEREFARTQEQFAAAQLARLVRADGAPLIAALFRIANGYVEPALAFRRDRLTAIAMAASRNETVPPSSF